MERRVTILIDLIHVRLGIDESSSTLHVTPLRRAPKSGASIPIHSINVGPSRKDALHCFDLVTLDSINQTHEGDRGVADNTLLGVQGLFRSFSFCRRFVQNPSRVQSGGPSEEKDEIYNVTGNMIPDMSGGGTMDFETSPQYTTEYEHRLHHIVTLCDDVAHPSRYFDASINVLHLCSRMQHEFCNNGVVAREGTRKGSEAIIVGFIHDRTSCDEYLFPYITFKSRQRGEDEPARMPNALSRKPSSVVNIHARPKRSRWPCAE